MQKRQLPSGNWQFSEGYKDKDGKYKRITVTKPNKTRATEKEAYEELQEKIKEKLSTEVRYENVGYYKKEFLNYKKNTVSKGTYDNYFGILKFLDDEINIMELDKLQLEKKLINLRATHSPKFIKQINLTFNIFFKFIKTYFIKDFDLHVNFTLTKEEKHKELLKVKYIDTNKITDVLSKIKNATVLDICKFQLLTGLRIGEVLALTKEDINITDKTITVNKTKTTDGKINAPKTVSSYRTIDINDTCLEILLRHLSSREYIFNVSRGTIYNHLQALNLKSHMFRHTHVALLIEAGVPIKAISERLGHSDTNITLSIYTHVTENMKVDLIEKLSTITHILRT